jgi:hypothetical protein
LATVRVDSTVTTALFALAFVLAAAVPGVSACARRPDEVRSSEARSSAARCLGVLGDGS